MMITNDRQRRNTNPEKNNGRAAEIIFPRKGELCLSPSALPFTEMYRGYFPLWRKITDWGWYKNANTMRVFVHLLLNTNFKESDYLGHKIYPGQVVSGRKSLASSLGLGERQVRTALNHLIATSEIAIKNCNKFSIITLINFDSYTIATSEKSKRSPKEVQQPTTSKNDKNDKNDKNIDTTYSQFESKFTLLWNKLANTHSVLSPVKHVTKDRRIKIKARYGEKGFVENIEEAIAGIAESKFLLGENDRRWVASFDWLIKNDTNYAKILEGKYKAIETEADKNKKGNEVFDRFIGKR